MIYLVAGTSRSGKTLLAKPLLREQGLSYLSLDWLMIGFNNGIPEFGIHHKLWPDQIARKLWPFLKGMLDNMLYEGVDYVIEGEAMLPDLLAPYLQRHPEQLRVVFLGYHTTDLKTKLAQVQQFSSGDNDWLVNEDEQVICEHISNMIHYSTRLEKSCRENQLPYFDTSHDFSAALNLAKASLSLL